MWDLDAIKAMNKRKTKPRLPKKSKQKLKLEDHVSFEVGGSLFTQRRLGYVAMLNPLVIIDKTGRAYSILRNGVTNVQRVRTT